MDAADALIFCLVAAADAGLLVLLRRRRSRRLEADRLRHVQRLVVWQMCGGVPVAAGSCHSSDEHAHEPETLFTRLTGSGSSRANTRRQAPVSFQ